MSRSHKKHFCCKDRNPYMKRYANRRVRQALNRDFDLELQHSDYRKFFRSWEICDWRFYETWEDYWESTVASYNKLLSWFPDLKQEFPDKDKTYREWCKFYYNK